MAIIKKYLVWLGILLWIEIYLKFKYNDNNNNCNCECKFLTLKILLTFPSEFLLFCIEKLSFTIQTKQYSQ